MSWRDSWQQGSFRGAAFLTEQLDGETGRRTEVHEYPQRDEAFVEDLGRKTRQFSVQCFVAGDDYMAARDKLIEACEAEGSGTLVHPTRGSLTVACVNCSWSESGVAGGICTFQLEFVEAGPPVSLPDMADARELVRMEAAAVEASAPQIFAQHFSVAGLPDFVEKASAEIIGGVVTAASLTAALQGGVGPALHAFETGLRLLPADAAALARTPLNLARSVIGFMQSLSALGAPPRRRIEAFRRMADHAQELAPVLGSTPPRERQRSNQDALAALVLVGAGAGLVRAIADYNFSSYDEAATLRDDASDYLDRLTVRLADRGDDDNAALLDGLRRAMIRDVSARGGNLARIFRWDARQPMPVQLVAQLHYDDPHSLDARCSEIVQRNRIAHPGFVPAITLELVETGQGR